MLGGAQLQIVSQIKSNSLCGWDQALVANTRTRPEEGTIVSQVRGLGVEIYSVKELRNEIVPPQDAIALLKLLAFFRRHRFDVVHTNSTKAGLLGRVAARLAGVPVIVHTVHGWGFHEWMPWWKRELLIRLERVAVRAGDCLIACAKRVAEKGVAVGIGVPANYAVIQVGIDSEKFCCNALSAEESKVRLGIPSATPVVGSVIRLAEQKDPLTLIRTFAMIAGARPEVRFLIVGDGPMRAQVQALARELGILGMMRITGLVQNVAPFLAAFDVFVTTSLWEGMPIAFLESMILGRPVVACAVDGVNDLIDHGKTGLLAPPKDVETLARHVIELLTYPHLRDAIGKAGREVAKQYDVEKRCAEIRRLYWSMGRSKGLWAGEIPFTSRGDYPSPRD